MKDKDIIYDESGFSGGLAMGNNTNRRASRYNVRKIEEIYKYGGEFYGGVIKDRGGFKDFIQDAYDGYEHSPENLSFKKPNTTIIWNVPFNSGGFMYGSSMGHVHSKYDFDVQEVYEFDNYGGMLVSFNDGVRFYVCKPRDKVAIPSDCMMAILNLSYETLGTADMANPNKNLSSKSLIERDGPMMAVYHTGENSSQNYYDGGLSKRFGGKILFPKDGRVIMKLNHRYDCFCIGEDEVIDFNIGGNKSSLVENILNARDLLRKYNVHALEADRVLNCQGMDGKFYTLDWPLNDLARENDKKLHRMFGMIGQDSS